MSHSTARRHRRPLLASGRLVLDYDALLAPLVRPWLPWPPADPSKAPHPAVLRVDRYVERSAEPSPEGPWLLRVGDVTAWPGDLRAVRLTGPSGLNGMVRPGRATIGVPDHAERGQAARELYHALTVAAALLLGGSGRTLIHAAAVVDPRGTGWLLSGDAHAGKSTTTLNLIRAGWDFLSDDQVVLASSEHHSGAILEGWGRTFHVDATWPHGSPSGRRVDLDPSTLDGGRRRATAPAGGLLFPDIVRDAASTSVRALPPAEALARLIRQTPWLMADRNVAPRVLALLEGLAALPAFELRLGRDAFGDARPVLDRLQRMGFGSNGPGRPRQPSDGGAPPRT